LGRILGRIEEARNSGTMVITGLILLAAIAILVWGYRRAQPYGSVGILAWLQSVALMAPWLLFFGLFALGVYINLAGVLLLLLVSTGLYVYLGRRLRALGQDTLSTQRPAPVAAVDQAPGPSDRADQTDQPQPSPCRGPSGDRHSPRRFDPD
jgi:hypothetical protein